MWYLTVVPGKPIIGFQPDPAEDLEPVTDEHMAQLHACPPDWIWDAVAKTLVPPPAPPPVDPGPRVPESINPWQARKILRRYNLIDSVTALIATLDADAQDGWEYALAIRRDNPLVEAVALQAGLSPAQLDQMFIEASAL